MQVRDLIKELREYPEDLPIAYMTKLGNPLEIEVERGEGNITRTGECYRDGNIMQQPYVGIKIAQVKCPKVSFKTRGEVKAEKAKIIPKVGEIWYSNLNACERELLVSQYYSLRINSRMLVDGTVYYYGVSDFGHTPTFGSLEEMKHELGLFQK